MRIRRRQSEDVWEYIARRTVSGPNGCLDWTGSTNACGYPTIWDRTRPRLGARMVLERKLDRPIRDGYIAMHTCDRPCCINPEHLTENTQPANIADMIAKGRLACGEQRGSKLTEQSVRTIRVEHAAGRSMRGLSRRYGVSYPTIRSIVRREKWAHVA